MNRVLCLTALAATTLWALSAEAGVSIRVGQPGFYGSIDIGEFPPPQVIYPQPVVIQPVPVGVVSAPIYLHVPPGHARQWSKHCRQYGACGQPVFFVQNGWYDRVYAPRYRAMRGDHHSGGSCHHGNGKRHRR